LRGVLVRVIGDRQFTDDVTSELVDLFAGR